jgi:lipoprotein-anchoring transpeptidase ErfK/SrfK
VTSVSRRDFLSLGLLSLGSLAFHNPKFARVLRPPEDNAPKSMALGRVAADYIHIYQEPSFKSERIGRLKKDTLIPLMAVVPTTLGWRGANPNWYQTARGMIHSGHVQCVEYYINRPASSIPEGGQLGEITCAYAQGLRYSRTNGWKPFYRLYYQTNHWITDIIDGPKEGPWHRPGQPWYEITDERLRVRYAVPAFYVRLISPDEFSPISPEVPAEDKLIRVSISDQKLTAFEGEKSVFETLVSTGVHTDGPTTNGIPTDTPIGRFRIGNKMPSRHMGDGTLDPDIYAYELPGVPWNMFFVSTGVAFHGAYWHNNFGYRMSAGCVNLRPEDAKWLYRWTTPTMQSDEWYRHERGTSIDVVA